MYIDPVRYEGRPGNVPERLEKEQRCYALLDELQIPYARVDHEHADTIEACEPSSRYSARRSVKIYSSATGRRRSFIC